MMRKMLRQNVTPEMRQKAAEKACARLCESKAYKNAGVIFSYMALELEADTSLIHEHVLRDKKTLLIPKIEDKGHMEFYAIDPTLPLEAQTAKNDLGIAEPVFCSRMFSLSEIEAGARLLVLVPGLIFTPDGMRLGRGGGYYDRYIARLKDACASRCASVCTAGYCFSFQLIDDIPAFEHDMRMDFVLTPDP